MAYFERRGLAQEMLGVSSDVHVCGCLQSIYTRQKYRYLTPDLHGILQIPVRKAGARRRFHLYREAVEYHGCGIAKESSVPHKISRGVGDLGACMGTAIRQLD